MDNSNNDESAFEELFKDRFTEKDKIYNEVKTKTLPPPPVIHPWKVKKAWKSRNWDYSAARSHHGRDDNRSRYNDRRQSYRDRSPHRDGNGSRHRNEDNRSNRHYEDRNAHRYQEDRRGSNSQYRRNDNRD
ncbi:hypothetical protein JTE90_013760 [Oedothorax gibbosus]|uniref:Uncharacterized protein n=1 Tax=Oedothorax gibbosus TaxID=931172 RepID=A0AAV6UYG3_9ARAC|nr:hypothetical protein JTE90_013760 [Oedothorax gibbosus]